MQEDKNKDRLKREEGKKQNRLIFRILSSTYMDYEIKTHPHAGTATLPRMAAALPQLLQRFASSRPVVGGVTPDQIRGGRERKGG